MRVYTRHPRLAAALLSLLVLSGLTSCRDLPSERAAVVQTHQLDQPIGTLTLPNHVASVKFAVIGDSGRGNRPQEEVAAQMVRFREHFKFPFVLMLGDNLYEGPAGPEDYRSKFEQPYRALLDAGVEFYAVLGNHDDPREVDYAAFNMEGERYYSFSPPEDVVAKISTPVEFFAVDTTNLDGTQLRWLDERLGKSKAQWKVCFFHHPLYTSGRYRNTSRAYRWTLEPLLVRHGVNVVFSGHEHIYERSELQSGIQYFVSGGAGSLRIGDAARSRLIARSYDQDYHFLLIEIDGDELHFQAISRTGQTIDAGALYRDGAREEAGLTTETRLPQLRREGTPVRRQ